MRGEGSDGQARHMKSLLAFPFEPSMPLADALGPGDFKIRAAESWSDRSSASLLVSRVYASRGYKHDPALEDDPQRLTLVAVDHHAVVATVTIGFDSRRGLLVDELFPDEADALRDAGFKLCEFTKLAADGLVRSQGALATIFHVAFIHAHRIRGCDVLLIEVNPRHVRYYEAKLGFEVRAPARRNLRVDAPAVLMSLDLRHAQEQVNRFGGQPQLAAKVRSLYPLGFSPGEESGIVGRLRAQPHHGAAARVC